MSEELLQRNLLANPEKIGPWDFYNIGSTSVKALKEHNIIRNVDYGEEEKKKIDGLIVQKKVVIAVIEYKKPAEFNTATKRQKAIKQEIAVAKKLDAKIFIATDTKSTVWVNVATGNFVKDENGADLKVNFDHKSEDLPTIIERVKNSISEKNDQIKPKKLVNPTDLAKQIWQDIWSVSGATPENCLYTFVELFIFKYLSDLGVLQGLYSFNSLVKSFDDNTAEEVLETYATTIRPKIKTLFPENPIDKTTIINGTIFVSKDQKAVKGYSTVFKKVLGKFRDYGKLENIDYDFKSQLFESFLKESISKKNWGQFFTPLRVVRAVVEMAKDDIREGIKICDPACGVGKFLLEPIVKKIGQFFQVKRSKLLKAIEIHGYDKGFDKDEQKTIILAKANMLIYFSDLIKDNPSLTKEFSQLFNDSFILKTNSILGTLSDPVEDEFDLILTNPPYVTSGSSNLKEEIKKDGGLGTHYKINGMGVEGLFMEWIVRALKPGGKAFIIVPDGIFNRQNDKNLRQFLLDECIIDGIISLPLNTFFTTNKKTYILCLSKKTARDVVQQEPVFTYLVSEIGESRDVYRFEIEQDDLREAVALFSFFKGNKNGFEKINRDKRCKVWPISDFDPDKHWSVDRWWTKEEKIELGIIEKEETLTTSEFGEYVGEIANSFNEFKLLLKEIDEEKKKFVKKLRGVSLSDSNLFELFIGKRLLKKDLIKIDGTIPVYSANVFAPISFHTHSNINDFHNDCVIWGIDGDFEFNFIPKGEPFSTTDHCGTIRIKNDKILPQYLISQLYSVRHKYGFDRGLRASLKNMQKIEIAIPINENGEWDIVEQDSVVKKFSLIEDLKASVSERIKDLNLMRVKFASDDLVKMIPITTLFSIIKGKGIYTKRYGHQNPGEFPVFSASNHAPLTNINSYDYDGEFLSWATNGFAGFIKILSGKFSINADRALLEPLRDDINILYVKFILEPILRNLAKGRKGDNGQDEFTKVYPTMVESLEIPVPIDSGGNFSVEKQAQFASKCQMIEDLKASIKNEMDKILQMEITYD